MEVLIRGAHLDLLLFISVICILTGMPMCSTRHVTTIRDQAMIPYYNAVSQSCTLNSLCRSCLQYRQINKCILATPQSLANEEPIGLNIFFISGLNLLPVSVIKHHYSCVLETLKFWGDKYLQSLEKIPFLF